MNHSSSAFRVRFSKIAIFLENLNFTDMIAQIRILLHFEIDDKYGLLYYCFSFFKIVGYRIF